MSAAALKSIITAHGGLVHRIGVAVEDAVEDIVAIPPVEEIVPAASGAIHAVGIAV
jgi:hypothetical protein